MASMCEDFDDSDDMEENDDEFGGLGSILSWDEEEDNDNAVSRQAAAMSSTLRERDNGTTGTSVPPDLVQFSTKDGVPQFSFLQNSTSMTNMAASGSLDNASTSTNGNLTLQLPLPTPISSFSTQHDQVQQPQQVTQQNAQSVQQPIIAKPTAQPIASSQTNANQQVQQAVQQQQLSANFAQLLAQAQAGGLLQQQQQQPGAQRQQVPLVPMNVQQMQQPQQQQQNAQQQAQLQMAFSSDPNAFLQQLQFAQLRQQLQAAQQQHQQIPNVLQQQQQIQAQFVSQQTQQTQAAAQSMPTATQTTASATSISVPQASQSKLARKPAKAPTGLKTLMKAPPKARAPAVTTVDTSMVGLVSASDTDGESRKVKQKKVLPQEPKKLKLDLLDTTHMTEAEKVKANRDRNREHARNTRLRKKAYLEKLKTTVDELCRERDTLVSERASAANLLVEMHNTRTEVLMSFFALRTSGEKRRKLWASILDESCFTCVLPVTPYRSFPASEVQVSKCLRTVMGIDGMMADTASLHVLCDSMVDRSKYPNESVNFRYTLVTEEAVVAGNQMMARWVMTTTNAVQLGAKMEVAKQGMLCCKFNTAHKIVGLELMFDVMAFMLQLKQAARSEGFSVIPNTVQTCQKSFDRPMVVTLAEPPYTIIQVNDLWESMTGYSSAEVVGKVSCSMLQSADMDREPLNKMMQEIRYKRPASALLVNKTKSGDDFTNYMVVFPLSTDSRIGYYLGLTLYSEEGRKPETVASVQHVKKPAALTTSQAAALPEVMYPGIAQPAKIAKVEQMPPPLAAATTPGCILDAIKSKNGSILGGMKRPRD